MDQSLALNIALPPHDSGQLLRSLHQQLKLAIFEERLQAGVRMPSTRKLAESLGVSRNTVVAAYDLLLSEGYLITRPGSGTMVAAATGRRLALSRDGEMTYARRLNPIWREQGEPDARLAARRIRYDLRLGLPDHRSIPFAIWRRLAMSAMRSFEREPAAYSQPAGRPALREAISKHISYTRAVGCRPEDIVVTAGAQQAFDLLARILVVPGRTVVAVESPGYPPVRAAFEALGAKVVGVPVDEEGMMVEHLPADVHVICVTPSHQFPAGVVMSAARRAALLDVAARRHAVIIEDDYDSEFRFGGHPLDALQTLDSLGSVFYVGTFSKSLFPALRIGFVVCPPWAYGALTAAKRTTDWHTPVIDQETLASFIAQGHLARHVRKMRKIYGDRRAASRRALEAYGAGLATPFPQVAGLHLAACLRHDLPFARLIETAADAGIALERTHLYGKAPGGHHLLALGYGTIEEAHIDQAVSTVFELIRQLDQ